jgi:large subunit ribosomal protein L31e
MAEKKTKTITEKLEREYTIPLREKCRTVPRQKKAKKAIRVIKEFLVKHMQIYDRDLSKIRIEKSLNETVWARGIRHPPHKIKVKAIKEGDIVRVDAVEMPNKIKFKKIREEKRESEGKKVADKKKSLMEKAKEAREKKGEETAEDKDKDGIKDKKEEIESEKAVEESVDKMEKNMAKSAKHEANVKSKAARNNAEDKHWKSKPN